MKKLVIITMLLACQLNASEPQVRIYKEFPYATIKYVKALLNDPTAEWHPDFLECDRSALLYYGKKQWNVVTASQPIKQFWCAKFNVILEPAQKNGLRSYFIKESARGILFQSYKAQEWNQDFSKKLEHPVITVYSQLSEIVPKERLTPLSKGLIATATVGLVTAAHYAHKHNRLTRNISADAILQEQNDLAKLPENQCSEITG